MDPKDNKTWNSKFNKLLETKQSDTLKFKSTHDMIWIAMGYPGPLTLKSLGLTMPPYILSH